MSEDLDFAISAIPRLSRKKRSASAQIAKTGSGYYLKIICNQISDGAIKFPPGRLGMISS